jgi:putative GTP pyrophosphokinase
MQDIAGCRLIVQDLATQDEVVERLKELFDKLTIDDRRERPSHGYRAVHVIVNYSGKLIEIQIRTSLQDGWAQFSEKLSDVVDRGIKYGGGDSEVVSLLAILSDVTWDVEIAKKKKDVGGMIRNWERSQESFERLGKAIRRLRGLEDDISN